MTNKEAIMWCKQFLHNATIVGNLLDPKVRMGIESIETALKALEDIDDCRNELCYKCGNYKQSHLGACNDCRWRR